MREIKFRAWDERNEEMVYSDNFDDDGCFYINTKGVLFMYALPKSETGLETKYHKSYDVMQFTGLKDKNGVEIYEGDILQMYRHDDNTHKHEKGKMWNQNSYKNDVREVKFQEGTFFTNHDSFGIKIAFLHMAKPGESFEVIGNIHENPELLK